MITNQHLVNFVSGEKWLKVNDYEFQQVHPINEISIHFARFAIENTTKTRN